MRVTREKVAEHRRAILENATRLFRERGVGNVGVVEIMQASGLTHGAFYGHFRSKDELAREACREACAQSLAKWQETPNLSDIIDSYLSPGHRDQPASGCSISAFAREAAQDGTTLRADYTQGLEGFIHAIEQRLPGDDGPERRHRAVTLFATMVGALTLARSVANGDAGLSEEILASTRRALEETYGV